MLILMGALGLLQLTDGLMTHFFVSRGLAAEVNPLVAGIAGDVAFPFLKLVGAFACVVALWLLAKRFRRLALGTAAVCLAFYVGVVGWNIHTLVSVW